MRGGRRPEAAAAESAGLLLFAPLRIEGLALAHGAGRGVEVVVSGMGRSASERTAGSKAVAARGRPVAIAGFCGALTSQYQPGDVLVADRVCGPDGTLSLSSGPAVTGVLRAAGLHPVQAALLSTERLVRGDERRRLAACGAAAVDMESYWLLRELLRELVAANGDPTAVPGRIAVVRVVSDAPGSSRHPVRFVASGARALRTLARLGAPLRAWAQDVET